jgi:hypothetical protein
MAHPFEHFPQTEKTNTVENKHIHQTPELKNKGDDLHEMIRTNQDWINTTLSKEYVRYRRKEEEEDQSNHILIQKQQPNHQKPGSSKMARHWEDPQPAQQEDQIKRELLDQLDKAKVLRIVRLREKQWTLSKRGRKPRKG